MPENEEALDDAVRAVIQECDGNVIAALRVLVLANGYLEEEVTRLAEAVSRGYPRTELAATLRRRRVRDVQTRARP